MLIIATVFDRTLRERLCYLSAACWRSDNMTDISLALSAVFFSGHAPYTGDVSAAITVNTMVTAWLSADTSEHLTSLNCEYTGPVTKLLVT